MSLRAFHVVFIVASIALSLVVSVWGLREFSAGTGAMPLAVALASLASGVAMVVYGTRFFRKLSAL